MADPILLAKGSPSEGVVRDSVVVSVALEVAYSMVVASAVAVPANVVVVPVAEVGVEVVVLLAPVVGVEVVVPGVAAGAVAAESADSAEVE